MWKNERVPYLGSIDSIANMKLRAHKSIASSSCGLTAMAKIGSDPLISLIVLVIAMVPSKTKQRMETAAPRLVVY